MEGTKSNLARTLVCIHSILILAGFYRFAGGISTYILKAPSSYNCAQKTLILVRYFLTIFMNKMDQYSDSPSFHVKSTITLKDPFKSSRHDTLSGLNSPHPFNISTRIGALSQHSSVHIPSPSGLGAPLASKFQLNQHGSNPFSDSSNLRGSIPCSPHQQGFRAPPSSPHTFFDCIKQQFLNYSDQDRTSLITELLSLSSTPVISQVSTFVEPLLKKDPFTYLPQEVVLRIISILENPKDLAAASQVSRIWHSLLSDDFIWKQLCKTHSSQQLSTASKTGLPVCVSRVHEDATSTYLTTGGSSDDLAEAVYYPEVIQPQFCFMSFRDQFKHHYMINKAWKCGGRVAARYVIPNSSVVTALVMTSSYIIFALDNSRIFVLQEDGRLIRSLRGHVMGVWALAIWGDILISGGCDRDVRVWNLRTGECLHRLVGHSSTVRCIEMVNATTAISGSRDGTLRIWDIVTGECNAFLLGHRSSVRCISVDGDICVSGSYDFTAKVWRISTGELIHTLNGHYSQIYAVCIYGNRIATGSLDASIRIWDVETGTSVAVFQGHSSLVGILQIKGATLVSGASDGSIRVWDLKTLQCKHRIAAHDNSVTTLQFDKNYIVSGGSDGKVRIWNIQTGEHIRDLSYNSETVWRVGFRDAKMVIMSTKNSKVQMQLISFLPTDGDGKFSVDSNSSSTSQERLSRASPPFAEIQLYENQACSSRSFMNSPRHSHGLEPDLSPLKHRDSDSAISMDEA